MRFGSLIPAAVLLGLAAASVNLALAADWARFRGPNGAGVSPDDKPTPVTWSETENLKWKVALPGPGSSSPIVVGDRVFVTCWSGYGTDRADPGSQRDLRRHLLCIDRKSGETLWSRAVEAALPEDRYSGMFAEHGYASHTPVSDGERVYVFFGKTGALAFDLDGNQLWHTKLGSGSGFRGWGTASSPILYKNLVIITAAAEDQALVALDKETGKEVWRQAADGFSGTWGTPVLVEVDAERTDLVLGVPFEIWGINPDNGKLRWHCEAMDTDSYCSSVVVDKKVAYAIEGMRGGSIAVRVGGTDDVSGTHVVWSGSHRNRIGTPVAHDGRIYFVSGRIAHCIDGETGRQIYQSRLAAPSARRDPQARQPGNAPNRGFGGAGGRGGMGGQDYASPVIADGKLYYVGRSGDVFVIKLGPEFEQLAVNRLTSDVEDFSSTPAISDGELFIRSSKHLYCVADIKDGG